VGGAARVQHTPHTHLLGRAQRHAQHTPLPRRHTQPQTPHAPTRAYISPHIALHTRARTRARHILPACTHTRHTAQVAHNVCLCVHSPPSTTPQVPEHTTTRLQACFPHTCACFLSLMGQELRQVCGGTLAFCVFSRFSLVFCCDMPPSPSSRCGVLLPPHGHRRQVRRFFHAGHECYPVPGAFFPASQLVLGDFVVFFVFWEGLVLGALRVCAQRGWLELVFACLGNVC
jgi:hypothetical protein